MIVKDINEMERLRTRLAEVEASEARLAYACKNLIGLLEYLDDEELNPFEVIRAKEAIAARPIS